MVRFSDIIKLKDQKKPKSSPRVKKVREDKFRLSDSQIFKAVEEKRPPVDKPSRAGAGLEAVTYYRRLGGHSATFIQTFVIQPDEMDYNLSYILGNIARYKIKPEMEKLEKALDILEQQQKRLVEKPSDSQLQTAVVSAKNEIKTT